MSQVNFNDTTPTAPADGSVNIRWQSDTNGNISANFKPGAWQSWTPSVTPSGSMTASGVTVSGSYLRNGPICFFSINLTCTLGGTAGAYVQFGVPPSLVLVGGNTFNMPTNLSMNGAPFVAGGAYISTGAPNLLTVFPSGGGNWTLGAANVQVSGAYCCG